MESQLLCYSITIFIRKSSCASPKPVLIFIYVRNDPPSTVTPTASSSSSTPSPTNATSSVSSSNAGAIAGGVIAGVVVLPLLLLLAFWLCRRQRRRKTTEAYEAPIPFKSHPQMSENSDSFSPYAAESVDESNNAAYGTSAYGTMSPLSPLRPTLQAHNAPETIISNSAHSPSPSDSNIVEMYTSTMSPSDGSPLDGNTPGNTGSEFARRRSKRQEDLSRRVNDMQATIDTLQLQLQQLQQTAIRPLSPSTISSDSDVRVRQLAEEVERLRIEQRRAVWELSEAPPPTYQGE